MPGVRRCHGGAALGAAVTILAALSGLAGHSRSLCGVAEAEAASGAAVCLADSGSAAGNGVTCLTTEEAVVLALENSRQLRFLEAGVRMQEARRAWRQWLQNPEVRLRDLSTRSRAKHYDELEIGVRWQLPELGDAALARQEERLLVWERKVEARRARDSLASRVRWVCADIIMHRELMRIAAARADSETRRAARIKAMVDLGRRSVVDHIQARSAVGRAKEERAYRRQALAEEQKRLLRLTGASAGVHLVQEPLPEIDGDPERLVAMAWARRPEIHLVEAGRRLAAAQHTGERKQRLPWVSYIEVSHHREYAGDDWQELMLGINLPVFDWAGNGIQVARMNAVRADVRTTALRERIQEEVHEAVADYNKALLAWRLAREEEQTRTQEVPRVTAAASKHGTVSPDEIIKLQRLVLEAQEDAARSRRELAHALYSLYYALGVEEPGQALNEGRRDER